MSATVLIAAVASSWLLVVLLFARRLAADWREPVVSTPVLIIESDDWGPGPPADATRLGRLAAVLQEFRDAQGHPALATLGVVLAVPVGGGAEKAAPFAYVPRTIDATEFAPIFKALIDGRSAGVFALQLHGMEHCWPPALVQASQHDPQACAFLEPGEVVPRHETLPSHLQARWTNASQLPSKPLDQAAVERAVEDETACFARVFGEPARVAVPVTFTWTIDVEAAWASHGIRVVVTPGTRNVGRDAQGGLTSDGSLIRNGDSGAGGIVHVVRDIYFEPALGHRAATVLQQIRERHRLGRPALLETHRFNFTRDEAQAEHSLAEVALLLEGALATIPHLRFISTEALAEAVRVRNPAFVDSRLSARVRAFVMRAATHSRLRKLAWASGLALIAAVALAVASALQRRPNPQKSR